ncbi:MAG: sugar ABC transporter ATP-binding protein [Spirochaetales bacterium]|nr:sugar ABC transporter ATP-binding protein [Spirochaetales bacterium]
MGSPILQMRGIKKSFPGVKALKGVDLDIYPGECHALLGENGAGKSTLIKILAGIHREDEGEITIYGEKKIIPNVHASKELGISVIHQELILVPYMTIAENIFLGQEIKKNRLYIDKQKMEEEAQLVLDRFELGLSSKQNVATLSVAQQQMVEIAKALSINAKIIIMDEPTAALTNRETKQLFDLVEKMKMKNVAIIFVSHRMDELYEITEKITVMRDGTYIGTCNTNETERKDLIAMMVGRTLNEFYQKRTHDLGEKILEIKGLNRTNVLEDINLTLHKGEILGLSGIVGAGRTELARAIFGIDSIDSGSILYNGNEVLIKKPEDAMNLNIGFVPEDRKRQGLFLQETLGFNISIQSLKKCFRFIQFSKTYENLIVNEGINSLSIKAFSSKQNINDLSGGNQQKAVIAKWLALNPKVLILDEPTRGIDVGAKSEIYKIISDLAASGVAIIMISSELPEVLNMSDRILVMYKGRITGELMSKDATQEKIMHLATGGINE